jgi:hypothetical protein
MVVLRRLQHHTASLPARLLSCSDPSETQAGLARLGRVENRLSVL